MRTGEEMAAKRRRMHNSLTAEYAETVTNNCEGRGAANSVCGIGSSINQTGAWFCGRGSGLMVPASFLCK